VGRRGLLAHTNLIGFVSIDSESCVFRFWVDAKTIIGSLGVQNNRVGDFWVDKVTDSGVLNLEI
jgi:hypothetical protein